jgi:hypothetical protein
VIALSVTFLIAYIFNGLVKFGGELFYSFAVFVWLEEETWYLERGLLVMNQKM